MLSRAFDEAGLSADAFWKMNWLEFDSAVFHVELQQQRQMQGPRLVATMLFNAHFTNKDPKLGPIVKPQSPQEFLPLPLLDGSTPSAAVPKETHAETWARLKAAGLLD